MFKNLFSGQHYALIKIVIIVMMYIFRSAYIIVEKKRKNLCQQTFFLINFLDKIIFGSTVLLVTN